jgi:agmatine/peptidylarginine deiminase
MQRQGAGVTVEEKWEERAMKWAEQPQEEEQYHKTIHQIKYKQIINRPNKAPKMLLCVLQCISKDFSQILTPTQVS